jgi:serine/threonine protein phosphatase PrpC
VMLRLSGVAESHPGLVRSGNEDSGFLGPTCILVADGVGGAAAGEVASATAAYVVSASVLSSLGADPEADPVEVLRAAVRLAQEQILVGVVRDPAREGMATTLTAIVGDGSRFAMAHLGDSRGYLLRDDSLTRITHDHTYVQRLVDQGTLRDEDVRYHPWRNVVTRSVNGNIGEVDDVREIDLRPGDRLLLASDGLTDLVPDRELERLMAEHHDDAAVDAMVAAALEAGGHDNVTCLVATVVEGPEVSADGILLGALRDPRNVVDAGAVRMPHSA